MVMMGKIGNLILEKDERKKNARGQKNCIIMVTSVEDKIKIASKLEIMSIIIEQYNNKI